MKILSELDELDKPNGGIRIGYIISVSYQKPESLIRLESGVLIRREIGFLSIMISAVPDQEFNLLVAGVSGTNRI